MSNSPDAHETANKRALVRWSSVPVFWPIVMVKALIKEGASLYARSLKFVDEEVHIHIHSHQRRKLAKQVALKRWNETPIDLPGRCGLQVVQQRFQGNRLAKDRFVALARTLKLRDITTTEQVLNSASLVGMPADQVQQKTVPSDHIGPFIGDRALTDRWPPIARWIAAPSC